MKDLASMIAVLALALAVVAGVVIGGHDTTVFVSPPEAVAEEFTRKLATGRYDMALEHLAQSGRGVLPVVRTSGETLRAQAGEVNQVQGESSAIAGDEATARVTIATENAGDVHWTFRLVRQDYEWKIRDWR